MGELISETKNHVIQEEPSRLDSTVMNNGGDMTGTLRMDNTAGRNELFDFT